MRHKVLLLFCSVLYALFQPFELHPQPQTTSAEQRPGLAADIVDVENVQFQGGEIHGRLINKAAQPVRDVVLLIRYVWVWKSPDRRNTSAPERSFYYTVKREIPPGESIAFSYASPPLPARDDGYYDTEVSVARLGEVSLGVPEVGRGSSKQRKPELKTHQQASQVVVLENMSVRGGNVSGKLRNRASHPVRDVELLIRHVWIANNEYKPTHGDPGKATYYTVKREIPPGEAISFSYESQLPTRGDGRFLTRVAVAGFVEIGPDYQKVDREPPRIRLSGLSPEGQNGARFEATIEDESGVAVVEVWLNGVKAQSGDLMIDPGNRRKIEVVRKFQMPRFGDNCIAIAARDSSGNGSISKEQCVYREPLVAARDRSEPVKAAASPAPVAVERTAPPTREEALAEKIPQKRPAVEAGDKQGPRILLSSPLQGVHTDAEAVELEARLEDASGIENVEVWLNGSKAFPGGLGVVPAGRKTLAIERLIALPQAGDNCVAVTAIDTRGNTSSEQACFKRGVRTAATHPIPQRERVGATAGLSSAKPVQRVEERKDETGPDILIGRPLNLIRIDEETITFEARVEDPSGIKDLELRLNGSRVATRGVEVAPRGRRSLSFERRIDLPAVGRNCIGLTATDARGNRSSEEVCVIRERAAVASAPPSAPGAVSSVAQRAISRGNGHGRYALIIGIGDYQHAGIPDLAYAHADAKAVYELVTDPARGGFKMGNVKLILGRDATRRNIMTAVGDWLFRKAGPGDEVFLYYAGHGAVEKDRTGREPDGLTKYLVPADALPDNLFVSGISNDELSRLFSALKTKRLVFFLDSCYAGGTTGMSRGLLPSGFRSGSLSDDLYQRLSGSGQVVVAAAQPNQVAMELPKLGHGLFTNYMLDGLKGRADTNGDGRVTLLELYPYLSQEVPRIAREEGGYQDPVLRGSIAGDLFLASVPETIQRISMEHRINVLKKHYTEGRISAKQFDRAVRILESGEENKLLEDFMKGDISSSTFRRLF